jgi:hypothetical protein
MVNFIGSDGVSSVVHFGHHGATTASAKSRRLGVL